MITTLQVYLGLEGQEALAKGLQLWPWHYSVRSEKDYPTAEGAIFLGEFSPQYPSREACIPPVLELLKKEEQEIQAQAYADLQEVKERRDQLLMIGYAEPTEVPTADDIPL